MHSDSTCKEGPYINPVTPHNASDLVTSLPRRTAGYQRSRWGEGMGSEGVNHLVN